MSVTSFGELADVLEDLVGEIQDKRPLLIQKVAESAEKKGNEYFPQAFYAGTNDVKVSHKMVNEKTAEVVAEGDAVTFIEFGTGTVYPDAPADQNEKGFVRGTFGDGMGAHPPWHYYGEPGNAPMTWVAKNTSKGDMVVTYGNPANLCLHRAKDQTQEMIPKIAKEVFGK